MEINKRFFPKIMQDNDLMYFAHLEGIINSIDELSSLEITKSLEYYKFRLAPSVPRYIPMIIEELLKFHNLYKIRLNMSKSIKTSATIEFKIQLN